MLESWLAQYPDLPATPMMRAMLAFRSNPDALVGGNRMAGRTLSATDAQNLYAQGQDRIVLGRALATSAFREASGRVAFYAGLSAWRLGEVPQSQQLFAWAANADRASKDLRSAASWWAGRAAGRAGNTKDAVRWLVQSARCKDCFYGVIARHTLDKNESQNDTAVIAVADVAVVAARPAGHRAMALLQVGRMDLAEAELHNDWANADNINERQSIGLIAHALKMLPEHLTLGPASLFLAMPLIFRIALRHAAGLWWTPRLYMGSSPLNRASSPRSSPKAAQGG